MLKLFVSYFSPFCKNYFLATFERFNKNFTQNKKKKRSQVDCSVLFSWWFNFGPKVFISDWGFGRIGPLTVCYTGEGCKEAPQGAGAPDLRPHHCCLHLLGLPDHHKLHIGRVSFQPLQSSATGALASPGMAWLASGNLFTTSGCVFQFAHWDPEEEGEPKRWNLSLKRSRVTFLVVLQFQSWSGAPLDFPALNWRCYLQSVALFKNLMDNGTAHCVLPYYF